MIVDDNIDNELHCLFIESFCSIFFFSYDSNVYEVNIFISNIGL